MQLLLCPSLRAKFRNTSWIIGVGGMNYLQSMFVLRDATTHCLLSWMPRHLSPNTITFSCGLWHSNIQGSHARNSCVLEMKIQDWFGWMKTSWNKFKKSIKNLFPHFTTKYKQRVIHWKTNVMLLSICWGDLILPSKRVAAEFAHLQMPSRSPQFLMCRYA